MYKEELVSVRDYLLYREIKDLHQGDGAEEGSRLPVADDR